MKAVINGINVEGTVEEIMEFQRLQEEKSENEERNKYVQTSEIFVNCQVENISKQFYNSLKGLKK